jgi:chromosome segregation ATPase
MTLIILLGITTIFFLLLTIYFVIHYSFAPKEADLSTKSPEQLRDIVKFLRIDYKDNKEHIERLEKETKEYTKKLEKAKTEAIELSKKLEEAQSQIVVFQADKVILDKQLLDANNARKALIEELDGSSEQMEVLLIENPTWNILISKIKQVIYRVEETEIKIHQITQENDYLNQKYQEISQRNMRLDKDISIARNELANAREKLKHTEEELEGLKIKNPIRASASSISKETSPITRSQSSISSNQIPQLENTIQGLRDQLAAISNPTDQEVYVYVDNELLEYVNDELQNLVDYLYRHIEKLRQENDRDDFRDELFKHAGYNLWGNS